MRHVDLRSWEELTRRGHRELEHARVRATHAAFAADTFQRCVARCGGEHKAKSFSCLDHYPCTAFAQLTDRGSPRDIEACLRTPQLYHRGIKSRVSRSTLADANEMRIYAGDAQSRIGITRRLSADEPFGVDLKETVYAFRYRRYWAAPKSHRALPVDAGGVNLPNHIADASGLSIIVRGAAT